MRCMIEDELGEIRDELKEYKKQLDVALLGNNGKGNHEGSQIR
jgi:hypothetical protein